MRGKRQFAGYTEFMNIVDLTGYHGVANNTMHGSAAHWYASSLVSHLPRSWPPRAFRNYLAIVRTYVPYTHEETGWNR